MKHQKVSVDVWAMVQSMAGYLALVLLGGFLLRLLIAAVTLPGRLRQQRENMQDAMKKLQEKYPEAFQEAMDAVNDKEKNKYQEDEVSAQQEIKPIEEKKDD